MPAGPAVPGQPCRASRARPPGPARLAQHGWPSTAGLAGMETPLKREYSKVDNKKKDETMHEFFNGHFTHSVRIFSLN